MSHFIAFQNYIPKERGGNGCCIWCKSGNRKNRAHIVSKKLASNPDRAPVLSHSICESCNAACGKLEDWILRYTPLGWVRYFLYPSANRNSRLPNTPSYYYASDLKEWVVYRLNPSTRRFSVPPQLLLTSTTAMRLITEESPETMPTVRKSIFDKLESKDLTTDVRPTLPDDFSPRALLDGQKLVLVAKTDAKILTFLKEIEMPLSVESAKKFLVHNLGKERQHFRWSKENWVKFCVKVSYETLSLCEGQEFCLRPCFDRVRECVLSGPGKTSREVIFDRHGPFQSRDVPQPVYVDITKGQNSPQNFDVLLSHAEPGMHSIVIYEMDGWICSSVSFAGFPPSALILAGPNEHLKDIYHLVYDELDNQFQFSRLAFDPSKPITPMTVNGDLHSVLAKTYQLRPL